MVRANYGCYVNYLLDVDHKAGTGRQLGQARDACNRALALEPGAPGALNSRGLVYLRMKRFGFAIADYTLSLRARPEQASARFGRGLARLSAGEVAGATDIIDARRRDSAIDEMFIAMGVLPARCDRRDSAKCPPGFPPAGQKAPGAYMMVSFDPGQEIAAGAVKAARERRVLRLPAR